MITTVIKRIYEIFSKSTSILPLAIYRIAFGFLMCFSQLRFMYKGWIEDCYTSPKFHFTYQYFDWIQPLDTTIMYIIVGASAVFALFVGLGMLYRVSAVLFFISFTYLELIEKSWYLNHYYFASLVAFLLIWLPAHRNYSIDALIHKNIRLSKVPSWTIIALKLQIAVVYIFGGIAKLKSDWLFEAQPLKIWLGARTDIPLIGELFQYDSTAYAFSWIGMVYDLSIPFLLWNKRCRPWAYILVIIFHVLTYILFNIGMFPWLMMAGSLIFITADEWKAIGKKIRISIKGLPAITTKEYKTSKIAIPLLLIYFVFQFTFPLRHTILTDHLLWTENGLRFSWHVMIMEKNGFTEFTVVDHENQKKFTVYPSQHLTVIQEKQMSFQPDMIWQFAHYLKKEYNKRGIENMSIYVNSKVSLNGRPSQLFIDPKTDLLAIKDVDDIYRHVMR
ncbi:HTTM domain-containing protein [Aquimarina macrocephali]|uniref:HTTM domain-containing protein n=1 Tax=Aquimarina macrocephali TaxID=666563 RepID=UPI003F67D4B1